MAPQKPAPTELSRPKQSRFLIALFLAKSKPCNISTQGTSSPDVDVSTLDSSTDYISSLRKCVQEGRRLDSPSTSHSLVNTAEFWRNEFKRSEEAQTELRARIFELEKMLDAQEQSRSVTPAGSTSQKKRRRGINEIEGVPGIPARERSRMAVDEPTLQDAAGALEIFVNDMKSASDHDGEIFLQSFSWR